MIPRLLLACLLLMTCACTHRAVVTASLPTPPPPAAAEPWPIINPDIYIFTPPPDHALPHKYCALESNGSLLPQQPCLQLPWQSEIL